MIRFKSQISRSEDCLTFQRSGLGKRFNSRRSSQGVSNFIKSRSFTDDEVFNENSPVVSGHRLTKRLLRLGWTYKCECDLDSWRGKPLTLHLDHINGMRNDNRFSNLRFLCPNCHQQTETWGNKKRKQDFVGELAHPLRLETEKSGGSTPASIIQAPVGKLRYTPFWLRTRSLTVRICPGAYIRVTLTISDVLLETLLGWF